MALSRNGASGPPSRRAIKTRDENPTFKVDAAFSLGRRRRRIRLTVVSEYPTLGVMKSDVPSLAPPPPTAAPPTPLTGSRPLSEVRNRTVSELERDLEETLRRGMSALELAPAGDGTPEIASLVAVWLLSEVEKAIGEKRPVDLSKVPDSQQLRSVGGVARLLHAAFHPVPSTALAS